ncbi:hypothetical protein BDU57DRAFT_213434 [Ampelomyces quisqualis]|uniref:Uncharacterized protein n=1 Tax=Ampelomyces quisqualis TaxID=50730 RepID=A0A6A5QNE6_AMPQU|nr:hypothetical protein BDU57DRAFT_213434 [Ampelomyces quisqualis]
MLTFIDRGTYTVQPRMRAEYPTATMLDLHIHAYLAGTKYAVPELANYARKEYVALGDMSLQTVFDNNLDVSRDVMALDPFRPDRAAGTAIVKAFLESLAMLWRNTPNRGDQLRAHVVELLKHHLTRLVKVPFFGTLMREVPDLGRDIEDALGDDGLAVVTFCVNEGENGAVRFS